MENKDEITNIIDIIENIYQMHPACFSIGLTVVFGALFGWLFCYKKNIKICYFCSHNNIVSDYKNVIDFLKIRFKNKLIDNFSITKFIIFNCGNIPLKNTDIAPSDLFGLKINNGEFLDAQIIDHNKGISEPTISFDDKKTIRIGFHHMNPQAVLVLQVCHTSKKSKDIKLICEGAGVYKIKKITPYIASKRLRIVTGTCLTMYALLFIALLLKKKILTDLLMCSNNSDSSIYIAGGAVVIMFVQFLSVIGYTWRWRYWGKMAIKNDFWKKHDE